MHRTFPSAPEPTDTDALTDAPASDVATRLFDHSGDFMTVEVKHDERFHLDSRRRFSYH